MKLLNLLIIKCNDCKGEYIDIEDFYVVCQICGGRYSICVARRYLELKITNETN